MICFQGLCKVENQFGRNLSDHLTVAAVHNLHDAQTALRIGGKSQLPIETQQFARVQIVHCVTHLRAVRRQLAGLRRSRLPSRQVREIPLNLHR